MARPHQGKLLGLPYNFTLPKRNEVGKGVWDPDDDRIFTPKNVGWGYGVNVSALSRRIMGGRRPPEK